MIRIKLPFCLCLLPFLISCIDSSISKTTMAVNVRYYNNSNHSTYMWVGEISDQLEESVPASGYVDSKIYFVKANHKTTFFDGFETDDSWEIEDTLKVNISTLYKVGTSRTINQFIHEDYTWSETLCFYWNGEKLTSKILSLPQEGIP